MSLVLVAVIQTEPTRRGVECPHEFAATSTSEAALAETPVEAGEAATVSNRGQTAGETTVRLTLDGSVVDSRPVTVEDGDAADVALLFAPVSPGECDLAVGKIDLDTLSVDAAGETESETTPADDAGGEETEGDPALLAGLIVALTLLAALLLTSGPWRRQE